MTTLMPLTCLLAVVLATPAHAQAPTVTFTPTAGVPTFANREPVLRLKPGSTVDTKTFSKPGDYYEPAGPGPWPGEVGPFYIEGAPPNDTLVVKILRLRLNRDTAISAINPTGIAGLAADYGFDRLEAFQVVSQAGSARVANIVDPNYTVVAKFPKSLLPR